MFGSPKAIFKMLRAAGIRVRFDVEKRALVIIGDDSEQVHNFDDIEKLVNGENG